MHVHVTWLDLHSLSVRRQTSLVSPLLGLAAGLCRLRAGGAFSGGAGPCRRAPHRLVRQDRRGNCEWLARWCCMLYSMSGLHDSSAKAREAIVTLTACWFGLFACSGSRCPAGQALWHVYAPASAVVPGTSADFLARLHTTPAAGGAHPGAAGAAGRPAGPARCAAAAAAASAAAAALACCCEGLLTIWPSKTHTSCLCNLP